MQFFYVFYVFSMLSNLFPNYGEYFAQRISHLFALYVLAMRTNKKILILNRSKLENKTLYNIYFSLPI